MGIYWSIHSWYFILIFYLLIFWYRLIMRFHGVNLLRRVVELYGIDALVSSIAGFLVFKWLLVFRVVLKHFLIFGIVSGAM